MRTAIGSSRMNTCKVAYRQFLCVVPLCCQFFEVGLIRGWIAPILKDASEPSSELPLTSEESSWMASLNYVSRGFSPILLPLVVDRIGRNSLLCLTAFINFSIWPVVYCSRDVFIHYVLRFFSGLSDGILDGIACVYVCENCSPHLRGRFLTVAILFYFAGCLTAFILADFCSYSVIATVSGVVGFLALMSSLLLVEPAQYYLMKGDTKKAEQNFARLRDLDDPVAREEFEALKTNIEEEKLRTFDLEMLRSKEVIRSFRVILIILILCSGCGIVVVQPFVTKLFSNSSSLSANQFTILLGLFQMICAGVSPAIIDKVDRRTLFMMMGACMSLINAGIVALYCIQYTCENPYFDCILFVLLTTFSCIAAMFVYPLMGIIRGELLPQSVKMVGVGISSLLVGVISFVVARTFLPIAEAFGIEFNFVIYSCSTLILVVYVYFDLPETRGKTLVQIQDMLKYGGENTRASRSKHGHV